MWSAVPCCDGGATPFRPGSTPDRLARGARSFRTLWLPTPRGRRAPVCLDRGRGWALPAVRGRRRAGGQVVTGPRRPRVVSVAAERLQRPPAARALDALRAAARARDCLPI